MLDLQDDQLTIKKVFDTSAERLFAYFTQPELLSQWHAPGEMTIPLVEVDLKVGGRYRIQMQGDDGKVHTATGEYKEIDPPHKIVYSWSWEEYEGPNTIVTILLKSIDDKTEVLFTHEGFTDKDATQHHSQGWTGIMANLEQFITIQN